MSLIIMLVNKVAMAYHYFSHMKKRVWMNNGLPYGVPQCGFLFVC